MQEELDSIKISELFSTKTLSKVKWKMDEGHPLDQRVRLQKERVSREVLIPELLAMFAWEHSGVTLTKGVNLRYDDGDISLIFDSRELFTKYCEEWELNVNYGRIDAEIAILKERLAFLEEKRAK